MHIETQRAIREEWKHLDNRKQLKLIKNSELGEVKLHDTVTVKIKRDETNT